MKKFGIGIGLVCALWAGGATAAPVQWTGVGANNHWYEIVDTPSFWDGAFSGAASMTYDGMTGYLATITSAGEQDFLNSIHDGHGTLWLGGSDAATEGAWFWVTEPGGPIPFTYTNWNPGEPNNYGDEDYLHGWYGAAWNDIYPGFASGYLVEYSSNPSAVPLPATLPLLVAGLGALGFGLRRRQKA